ncbi:MAG: peptide-methionine (S)-S-oxide reductase [Candidatus Harrisonbacteria bacterium CG10_big_fil_rev_8_21_14_0_10_42_17]|uniref:Peptide methionine sulfoxide reductase MsrA n=1 Tax=Candidatus Harrisonbacteria bacterium CG10_big_fil_rev_8_21_14_0_10_42_17 TaxID=1974584 RepID=A0A2M6WJ10_9BACT|nr:MAG: peptide-methionine (S)-S-oxide reductase [Candidatus Harrisonbacteria bacterium CG10_big_fil_rev_8_21_14_0_10_42_17]
MTNEATFAMGCFWHPDDFFSKIKGVQKTTVGYTGGHVPDPNYNQVCGGSTGHAEAVRIEFDPDQISYEELVKLFFKEHNPTTVNRQGPDVGEQYRSIIFYHDEKQRAIAERVKQKFDDSGAYPNPIVTQIVKAPEFYEAEEYHQKYFEKIGRS